MDDKRILNNSHKQSVGRSESRAKSRPRSQKGPRSNYVCHHYGLQGHTQPNCQKLRAMNNASAPRSRGPRNDKRNWAGEPSRGRNGDRNDGRDEDDWCIHQLLGKLHTKV